MKKVNTDIDAERVWTELVRRDLSEKQIRRALNLSGNRFIKARSKLLTERRIATVYGNPVTYTII